MFPCDICEALFDKKKRLGEHKRFVHKGVRRYKCDQCPKKFAVKSGLNNHVLIHSGMIFKIYN
jgi:KRAB domain-containing zinc finger protein